MSDGNLRNIFTQHLTAHFQPIETWSTGQGVPDTNYCFAGGHEGWIENKLTAANAVDISSYQVAWLERRARVGGRVFVAVRRVAAAGPRRGVASDELWLFPGRTARLLMLGGLKATAPLGNWAGGPAAWDWEAIRGHLVAESHKSLTFPK